MGNFCEQLEQLAREQFPRYAKYASDDARQNAYLYVWSHQQTIESHRMKPYIMSITKHPRFQDLVPMDEVKASKPAMLSWVQGREYQQQTRQEALELIHCAPVRWRPLLLAVYIEGYTYEECSKKFNLSISTVKYFIDIALAAIKEVVHEKREY